MWLGGVVLGAVILAVAFVIVTVQYGWQYDAVLSGSMEPKLAVGGLVVIRPVDTQLLKTGDVISFKLPDIKTPICHRVIKIEDTTGGRVFHTKGDANEEPDLNPVPAAAVKGMETFYLPYVGRLASLSKIGRERVNILGKGIPKAVLVILPLGLLFIGLSFKDALGEVLRPMQKRRKEAMKKRRARYPGKMRAFH
jgi:signal peptidase I